MKKRLLLDVLLLSVLGIILGARLVASTILLFIKYKGVEVPVLIIEEPASCERNNYINVLYDGKTFPVSISKENCRNRNYKTGQKITLIKHAAFDKFVWPDSNPELAFTILVVLVIFLFYGIRKTFRTHGHPAPHKRKPEK